MKRKISWGLLAVWFLAAAAFAVPDFSGEWVIRSAGRDTGTTARLNWTTRKWRAEMHMGRSFSMTMIGRVDINKLWVLNAGSRTYTESALDFMRSPMISGRYPGETARRPVGREEINSVMCNKFEVNYEFRGERKRAYQWISVDNQIAMKTADAGGTWSNEIRNLRIGVQPAALFELPSGYRRVPIPRI
ncbi:hypothetical protein HZB07_01355 [Candidatus Saganbacteria bacterium]|nr:hypothetical protein [Candidatus Saganbacteria bacterium]